MFDETVSLDMDKVKWKVQDVPQSQAATDARHQKKKKRQKVNHVR